MTSPSSLLSISEATQRLADQGIRVNRLTVWRWIKAGKLASLRTPGGYHLIRTEDVDALLTPVELAS